MISKLYIDIETGPLPESELTAFMPEFEAPANYKDPLKIQASIDEQKARWIEGAALSAISGQILCVGMRQDAETRYSYGAEGAMISGVLDRIRDHLSSGGYVVGFCIKSFDLPMLIRRAYRHGLTIPHSFRGRYWNDGIIDLADEWACHNRDPRDRISLDTLAKFLGIGSKNGDGKDFARLWTEDREKALAYLDNDLKLTEAAYQRMCGVQDR